MNLSFFVLWILCLHILKITADSIVPNHIRYDHTEEHEKRIIIPAFFNGTVYVPSLDGYISAVKIMGGTLLWKQNLQELTGLNTSYYSYYNEIVSTSTPTIAGDLLIIGIYGPAVVIGLERSTGKLVWSTHLHSHPAAVLSMPAYYSNGSLYIGTSSVEEIMKSEECCTFRGSVSKLDAETGQILWTTYMLPENNGIPREYAGAAIWNTMWGSTSVDSIRKHIYIATANLYSAPLRVVQCQIMEKNQSNPDKSCIEADNHSNSIVALDLETGEIMWNQHLGGCYCAPAAYSKAGGEISEAPLRMFLTFDNATNKDVVVVVLQDGFVLVVDRTTGTIIRWREPEPIKGQKMIEPFVLDDGERFPERVKWILRALKYYGQQLTQAMSHLLYLMMP
ncbi:hypothetical protein M5689_003003 [Euphorbia peplus]|nr:hypothetical protein M5689_003003 [Euphorbia peplus]